MSNLSPPRRLRTKTSDLTDFFRGAGHASSWTRHQDSMLSTSSATLEVPSGDEDGTIKKKITRIPLFGRSRKKSNQSATSSPFVSSSLVRDSSDIGEQSSRAPSPDRRPSESLSTNVQDPGPSAKVPTSLGSKFAAHFTHSRPSKAVKEHPEKASSHPLASSLGLAPPTRSTGSFESGSSSGSKSRSTTPRPPQPTIMVSLSSDNSEFKDLFTRSTDLPSYSSKAPSSSTTKAQSPQPSIYKRGYTPASAIAAAVRDQHNSVTHRSSSTSKTSTSISSKPSSSRRNSDSDKSNERSDGASTPRLSEARESPRPILPEKDKELPPSLQRRSSVAIASGPASESSSSSMRSRMKQPSARPQGRPPSVPLPLLPSSIPPTPPPSSPPSSPLPEPPANISPPSKVQTDVPQKIHVRARAHTISSVNNAPIPLSPPLSLSRTTSPLASASTIVPRASGGTLDIDNASTNELRQALKSRNKEYEELEASILKMTEAHAAQVASLEKKIALLEKEARKRETQIKGFTWLLNDGEAPQQSRSAASGPSAASRFASRAIVAGGSLSDHDGYRTSPLSPRRFAYQSDSGAESHATSGAESHRVSGASGSESTSSMFRKSKLRRLYLTGDTSSGPSRTGSLLRSSKAPPPANSEKPLPEAPYSGKRSSMSSVSPSPSSSTSSLLPPSPSITMSSLSAIPEASDPGGTLRLPRHESSELSDERRAIRQSRRISASSLTSSSTAASSSYSSNAKRSRPPSIAQVLDKSPNLGDVLEKLRPFS